MTAILASLMLALVKGLIFGLATWFAVGLIVSAVSPKAGSEYYLATIFGTVNLANEAIDSFVDSLPHEVKELIKDIDKKLTEVL